MGKISDGLVPFFEAHTFIFFALLFITYLVLHSDVFVTQTLSHVDGAVEGNYTTTWGTLITGALLVVIYMALLVFTSMLV